MNNIINYTNERLINWYKNAKQDYNIVGNGVLRFDGDNAVIDYTENGVSKTWSMYFCEEYISNGIDWIFNVWMEQAN